MYMTDSPISRCLCGQWSPYQDSNPIASLIHCQCIFLWRAEHLLSLQELAPGEAIRVQLLQCPTEFRHAPLEAEQMLGWANSQPSRQALRLPLPLVIRVHPLVLPNDRHVNRNWLRHAGFFKCSHVPVLVSSGSGIRDMSCTWPSSAAPGSLAFMTTG